MNASAAVLAGGRSTRMGRDKAWVEIDGVPMVIRAYRALEAACDEVFVVAKDAAPFEAAGLRAVADGSADQAPLVGIAAALRAAAHDRVFVCGCDMPSIEPDIVRSLVGRCDGRIPVVPVSHGVLQPLHSVWTRAMLPAVEAALRDGARSARRVLAASDRVEVAVDAPSLEDLDEPDDRVS